MKISIKNFTIDNKDLFAKALEIRTKVFIEEQKVDEFLEFDAFDKYATHYLVFEEAHAVATARYRETMEGIKLERFSVLKELRGRGYGKLILQKIMDDITPTPQLIYMHAQASSVDFYKQFGFEVIGQMFLEADIEHYMMIHKRHPKE